MKEEVVKMLVQMQLQWKFLHWQTFGDAKHRVYGEIYDGLGELIDEFVDELKITKMEFMLEWYYDSNRKRIIAHPKRYTPVYTAYNQDGFSLHNRTLFWLGYREHFKSTR